MSLLFFNKAYALEATSANFTVSMIKAGYYCAGGNISSSNYNSIPALMGETFTVGGNGLLSSANFTTYTEQLYLIEAVVTGGVKIELISDLKARTSALGPLITEKTWGTSTGPYFYWLIITEPVDRVTGFSISMDSTPDAIIDQQGASYQYSEGSLSSGKHIFYVLPFMSGGLSEPNNMLSFEIWVDVTAPLMSSLSPVSGAFLSDKTIPISCLLYDADSGLTKQSITLSLNNGSVDFYYDETNRSLTSVGAVLAEGENTVMLKACDNLGNCFTKAWEFIVDTLPPTGSILINGGDEISYSAYVNINIQAKDEISGLKYVYLSNDGVFDTELSKPYNYAPVISAWLVADPDIDGKKVVSVMFEDGVGNRSVTYKDDISLKLRTPDTRIVSGPQAITESPAADFAYEASKSGCSFKYKIDEEDWSEWSLDKKVSFASLKEGNHYFYVKSGYDANFDGSITIDEEDPVPAIWIWTIGKGELIEKEEKILFWRR